MLGQGRRAAPCARVVRDRSIPRGQVWSGFGRGPLQVITSVISPAWVGKFEPDARRFAGKRVITVGSSWYHYCAISLYGILEYISTRLGEARDDNFYLSQVAPSCTSRDA